MADKAALVHQIKVFQRADPDAKQAWWDYCDTHLQGVKDPSRHEADVLGAFVATYQAGGCAAPVAKKAPAMHPGMVAAAWGPYAQPVYQGGGAQFMQVAAPDFGAPTLAESVKMGQRKSHHWKSAWQSYIALYGSGFNDPAKYDENFITGFLDYLGQLGTADLTAAAAEQGINLQDAMAAAAGKTSAPLMGAKRPLSAAGPMAGLPPAKRIAAGGAPGGSEKDILVTKVKALQRSDPAMAEAYQSFCDTHCSGVKDPNRHDNTILQQFLDEFGQS